MLEIDKNEARVRIAAGVATLHDDTLIGPLELAALLSSTPQTVQKLSKREPGRLPPRAAVMSRRLVWHLGSVRAWIRARGTTAADSQARRLGAPRK